MTSGRTDGTPSLAEGVAAGTPSLVEGVADGTPSLVERVADGSRTRRYLPRRRQPELLRSRPGRSGAPWPLAVPAAIAILFLLLPLVGLLVRAPWTELPTLLSDPTVREALRLSLITATLATGVALVIGVPLAWVLARVRFPGRSLLRALVTLPLVLPPVVGGVALFLALGRRGLLGQYLDRWFGLTIPFTPFAVVLAETFVAMPFLVVTVEGALRVADTRYEEASATLGASRWTTFRRVTLPMIGPSVLAGSVLCWARALGEFGATITFAGNYPGTTQTMPSLIYTELQSDPMVARTVSMVLLFVSIGVLVLMRNRWLTRP